MPYTGPIYHGLNIRWSTNGITSTALNVTALIQTVDEEDQETAQMYPNQLGNTAIRVGFDFRKQVTFEYLVTDSQSPNGLAITTKPKQEDMFTVADSVDINNTLNGTNWIAESVIERRMSTDCSKITIRAAAFPAITV